MNATGLKNLNDFEVLFKQHYGDLVAYAFRFVEDEAEDIVQEVFFSFWKKKNTLTIESTVASYLFSAVKHKCLNKFRHDKVKQLHIQNVKLDSDQFNLTPHTHMVHKELESLIASSLADLPEKSLKIFTMNRYDRKKYREIADELSISLKSVEAHMSSVLKHLRLKLSQYMTIVLLLILS